MRLRREIVMGGTFLYALRMAITMVGCVVMLFFTSVKLTLLALACMPVVLLPIWLLGLRVRKLSRAVQDRLADVTSHVDETLHEIRTVQAYGRWGKAFSYSPRPTCSAHSFRIMSSTSPGG